MCFQRQPHAYPLKNPLRACPHWRLLQLAQHLSSTEIFDCWLRLIRQLHCSAGLSYKIYMDRSLAKCNTLHGSCGIILGSCALHYWAAHICTRSLLLLTYLSCTRCSQKLLHPAAQLHVLSTLQTASQRKGRLAWKTAWHFTFMDREQGPSLSHQGVAQRARFVQDADLKGGHSSQLTCPRRAPRPLEPWPRPFRGPQHQSWRPAWSSSRGPAGATPAQRTGS